MPRKDGRPRSVPVSAPVIVDKWKCTKCKDTFSTHDKALEHAQTLGHGQFSAA